MPVLSKLEAYKEHAYGKQIKDMGLEERLKEFKSQIKSQKPSIKFYGEYCKPVIGYDLDGVFYEFAHSLRKYIHTVSGRAWDTMPDPTIWEFWEEWNMELDEWLDWCNEGADAGYIFTRMGSYSSTTIRDVRCVANLKHILDAEIVIITDRHFGSTPEVSQASTAEWLQYYKFPYDRLFYSPDKTVYKTDYFIDDRPLNCETLKGAGTNVIMMDRPWNKNADIGVPRTKSILDFNTFILEKYYQTKPVIERNLLRL